MSFPFGTTNRISLCLLGVLVCSFVRPAFALNDGPQTFTLDGELFDSPADTSPLLDSAAQLTVDVLNPSKTCILYEEVQTVNTQSTNGYFNIQVGSAVGDAKRTSNDSGNTMATVFQNAAVIPGKSAPGQTCAGGSYTPVAGDARYFRITVLSGGVSDTISPDMVLDSVPNAIVAQSVQGLEKANILQVNTSGGVSLSQSNLESLFTGGAYTNIQSIENGNFMSTSSTGGATLPTYSGAPGSPASGDVWYDSTAKAIEFYNGSSVQTLGISGSAVTGVTAGTGLLDGATAGGTITSTGTLNVNVGTAAGQIVQLDGSAKIPAVDGSQLTNLNASNLSSGTIGGSIAVNTSGNITTSGYVSANQVTTNQLFSGVMSTEVANSSSGTTLNKLAKLSSGQAVTATTSDTTGLIGIVTGNAGTSGNADVAEGGQASCVFDGATSADDYVVASTTSAGECHDAGSTYPTSGQILGRVLSTNGSAGTYAVLLFPSEIEGVSLSSGVSGTLPVANGGTGQSSALTQNGIVYGLSTTQMATTGAGSQYQVFQAGASGVPTVGALALNQAAAISGNLPPSNGGTGVSNPTAHGLMLAEGSSNMTSLTSSAAGQIVQGNGSSSDETFTATPTLGVNGTTTGQLNLATSTASGQSITVQNGGATSAYNFNLPTTAGTSGYVLTSGGGGASPMTWTSVAPAAGSSSITTLGTVTTGTWNASTITVPYGGTGDTTLTAHGVLLGEGTSNVAATAAGTSGNILISGGSSADPSWGALNLAGGSNEVTGTLPVSNGGTGATTLTGAGIFTNGGNSFGAAATLGTADSNTLSLEAGGSTAMTILTGGEVGIGTTSPFSTLANTSTNIVGSDGAGVQDPGSITWSNNGSGYTAAFYNASTTGALANGLEVKVANNASSINAFDVSYGTSQGTSGTSLFKVQGNGDVGIGTPSPSAKLDIHGQMLSEVYNAGSSSSIDWNNGNLQYTSAACGAFTFSNMLEGGSYTLIVTGASGTCTFSQSSPDTLANTAFKFMPTNAATTGSTVFTFLRANNTVYVSWITGY